MSKSVYSLVLSDDIVRAVDVMAYKMNMSRSALIDRILAEQLSVQTPRRRMESIIESITDMLADDIFKLQAGNSGGMMIRSPLPFKYKPTIRYSVELSEDDSILGKLKVSFRTQNSSLSLAMNSFLNIYASIEAKYISALVPLSYEIDGDKMIRVLCNPVITDGRDITSEDIAGAIAEYVRFLDKAIKLYFECADDSTAQLMIDRMYRERMSRTDIIM